MSSEICSNHGSSAEIAETGEETPGVEITGRLSGKESIYSMKAG